MTPTIIHAAIAIALVIIAVLLHRRERKRNRLVGNEVWPFYVGAVINIVAALGYIIHY